MTQFSTDPLFKTALDHHRSGRLAEAQAGYQQLLAQQPNHAEALHSLGILLGQTGQTDAAVASFQRAIAINPGEAMYRHNLAYTLQAANRHAEAIGSFREALQIKPDFVPSLQSLALSLHACGQIEEAINAYGAILRLEPGNADALCNLGTALRAKGQINEAIDRWRRALELKPNLPAALSNLGNAFYAQNKLDEAIACYRRLLRVAPLSAETYNDLGVALQSNKQMEEAMECYRQAVHLRPNFAEPHQNLGNLLRHSGRLDEAVASLAQALQINPDFEEAHYNMGYALQEKGQLAAAMACYRRSLELNPGRPEAHNNLGLCYFLKGELDDAIAAYRAALSINGDFAEAINNLGLVLSQAGEHEESLACHRKARGLYPNNARIHSNLIFALLYHPSSSEKAIQEECRLWNQQHAAPLAGVRPAHANDRNPGRRLRVGYVSPDFRDHPVARFLLPLFENHDRGQVEIYCYSDATFPDAMTDRLKSHADHWRHIERLPDEQVALQIQQDGIDILVDLAMHSSQNRLLVFARKPAPVQVSWLAYPGSTGLETIDYRLTDKHMTPAAEDVAGPEIPLFLPDTFWCYSPSEEAPAVNALPALQAGHVTFGSMNNFNKVSESAVETWAELMMKVSSSRLIVHTNEGSHRERFLQRLEARGVARERCEFLPRSRMGAYFAAYQRIDVGLDSFPFVGGTTTCDALWMGVPVVTLAGRAPWHRGGVSVLSNVGLRELIAESPEEYVRIAAELAGDLPRLAGLRGGLRERMRGSALMDGARFARNMEGAYRKMWEKWCGEKGGA